MSIIKPRTRGKHIVEHRAHLDHVNRETLFAYAAFIDEDVDYVLNQLIENGLEREREFTAWRAKHQQSYAPPRIVRPARRPTAAALSRGVASLQEAPSIQAVSARE